MDLHGVGGPRWRLETMNLLHKSQFSRVHRPIKLNLTDHRRGAICLRRIDAEGKWGPTFRYNCRFRQTADAIFHCISYSVSFSFFFFLRIFVKPNSSSLSRKNVLRKEFREGSTAKHCNGEFLSLSSYVIDPISRISPAIRVTWPIS